MQAAVRGQSIGRQVQAMQLWPCSWKLARERRQTHVTFSPTQTQDIAHSNLARDVTINHSADELEQPHTDIQQYKLYSRVELRLDRNLPSGASDDAGWGTATYHTVNCAAERSCDWITTCIQVSLMRSFGEQPLATL